jgi:hypothetical protein
MSSSQTGDELPLPGYKRLDAEKLRERIEPLTAAQVEHLQRDAAATNADPHVVSVLDRRLEELRAALKGADAPGSSDAFAHHGAGAPSGGVSPQQSGPPVNPPSHGDPTNPAQPRG